MKNSTRGNVENINQPSAVNLAIKDYGMSDLVNVHDSYNPGIEKDVNNQEEAGLIMEKEKSIYDKNQSNTLINKNNDDIIEISENMPDMNAKEVTSRVNQTNQTIEDEETDKQSSQASGNETKNRENYIWTPC